LNDESRWSWSGWEWGKHYGQKGRRVGTVKAFGYAKSFRGGGGGRRENGSRRYDYGRK